MNEETFFRGDRDGTSREGATALRREIMALAAQRMSGPIVTAWCGGTSPDKLCRAFVDEFAALPQAIQQRVHFCLVDERRVPEGDPQSNFTALSTLLMRPLLERGVVTSAQFHPFPVTLPPDEASDHYSDTVEALGGFDIVILGVGPDAHIAALFPQHPLLLERELRYRYLADRPKPPSEGFTASPTLIASSKMALLLFFGPEKAEALRSYRENAAVAQAPVNISKRIAKRMVLTDIAE